MAFISTTISIISCGNVVKTATKIYLKIPVISLSQGTEQLPFDAWANMVVAVPMILLTTAPRFMTFILFFSNVPMRENKMNIPIILGAFALYAAVFWIGVAFLLKRRFHERILQSFMTSPFSPCIVMDPKSRLLIFRYALLRTLRNQQLFQAQIKYTAVSHLSQN